MTTSSKRNWLVFLALAVPVLAASALYWQSVGYNDESISTTIRHSARLAFLIFLLIIIVRPLQQLVRADWTATLRRNRRLLGVAFAGVMAAHLAMIVMRVNHTPDIVFPTLILVAGGIGYALIGLMFITSFDAPARALGPKAWKRLHRLGLVWIGAVFAFSLLATKLATPDYLKFGIPFAVALLIRITAWLRSRQRGS